MPEPIVIPPILAAALSLSMGASPVPASRADAAADTVAIVEAIVRDRLTFRGESPSTAYLVLVADPVRLCPPDAPEEGESDLPDEYTLPYLIRSAELDPSTTDEMRRALVCENAAPVLPSSRYEGAEVVLAGWLDGALPDIPDPEAWWAAFQARFPGSGGILRVAMPVFSRDRDHALIWVLDGGPGMCGTDRVVALARKEGRWRIVVEKVLGIS
jgi:hypothetical protein